ncbi:MAG: hypothetical protein ACYS8W_18700 [Planctomycetota bacterium]|jgi:hypothetical protein
MSETSNNTGQEPDPMRFRPGEVRFRLSLFGLNRQSAASFQFTVAGYIFAGAAIGLILLVNTSELLGRIRALEIAGVLFFLIFGFSAIVLASIGLVFAILGFLKPNPSFRRALVILVLPFLVPLAGLNLIIAGLVWNFYSKPTKEEIQTADALGIPLNRLQDEQRFRQYED